ncbi:hypothetical protein C1N53_13490 [Pontibacter sp. SGAir0037]|nr:hypothetical protein C1N53_13490 [Pontibacter sp. SGAir0037]
MHETDSIVEPKQNQEQSINRIQYTTLENEPQLAAVLSRISQDNLRNSTGIIMSALSGLDADHILRALQHDSSSYAYHLPYLALQQTRNFRTWC